MPDGAFEAVVVGGGLHGLATLYHLARLGCRRLALVERFRLGHERGSSHGQARMTRSTYPNPDYVRLMERARRDDWPELERDTGRRLVHPVPGCLFGPPGPVFAGYVAAVAAAAAPVEPLAVAEARRRFPQLRFAGVETVLVDRSAGLIAARETIEALAALCRRDGVIVHEDTRVREIDVTRGPIEVRTDRGVIAAERVVVTAGPWAGALLPALGPHLRPVRQTVAYVAVADAGRFPVWAWIADGESNIYYGLPEFGRPGIKAARHVTGGPADDPDADAVADETAVQEIAHFLATQLAAPPGRVLGVERCFYTMTTSEDFIIDLHPDNPHVAVGAGFSGHGFKFAPLTGRALAQLALQGQTDIPEFEALRSTFTFPSSRR